MLWALPLVAALVREQEASGAWGAGSSDGWVTHVPTVELPRAAVADTWSLRQWASYMEEVYALQGDLRAALAGVPVGDLGAPALPISAWQTWMEHSKWNWRLPGYGTDTLVHMHRAASRQGRDSLAAAVLHVSGRGKQEALLKKLALGQAVEQIPGVQFFTGGKAPARPEEAKGPVERAVDSVQDFEVPTASEGGPADMAATRQRLATMKRKLGKLRGEQEQELYALYMQATDGDNGTPWPDAKGKQAAWQQWDRLRGTSRAAAERQFLDSVGRIERAQARKAVDHGKTPEPAKSRRWGWWSSAPKKEEATEPDGKATNGGKKGAKENKTTKEQKATASVAGPPKPTGPSMLRVVGFLLVGCVVLGGLTMAAWSL